jgi:hypothetical protein
MFKPDDIVTVIERGKGDDGSDLRYQMQIIDVYQKDEGELTWWELISLDGKENEVVREDFMEEVRLGPNEPFEDRDALTVYLAGPISNEPKWKEYFNDAAARFRENGYLVQNAADHGEDDFSREEYMSKDFLRLIESDVVVLLPGWENSRGALVEYQVALETGKEIQYLDGATRGEPVELTASKLVRNGEREKTYGHPYGDMDRFTIMLTGLLWDYLKPEVTRIPVWMGPLIMTTLKINRLGGNPTHEDSQVDLLGWPICFSRVMQRVGSAPVNKVD